MKTRKSDLADFQDWLSDKFGYTKGTSTTYAGRIRRILRDTQTISEATLSKFISDVAHTSSKKMVDNYYVAWRKFCDYTKERINVELPSLPSRKKAKIEYDIPDVVWQAYMYLKAKNKAKLEVLSALKFGDLKLHGNYYEAQNPSKNYLFHKFDKEAMNKIINWGNPLRDTPIPIFPELPMSQKAIPIVTLKRLWREYKRHQP